MLICFSGIDGCGKGLQVGLLAKYLRNKNRQVFVSKAYASAEKEAFSSFFPYWPPQAILFLFQALHAVQSAEAERALERGDIVIADRWDDSYLSYHSQFGVLKDRPRLRDELNRLAFGGRVPDLSFLLQVDPRVAQVRVKQRGADFFDLHGLEYHSSMQRGFKRLARERKWVVLDGTAARQTIHRKVVAEVERRLSRGM